MQYTLSTARAALSDTSNAYGTSDLTAAINKAIDALAGMRAWQFLRKNVRFVNIGPVFALPQGLSGIVRACVNGNPTTVRGKDFHFIQSGPGDTAFRPPRGFTPTNVIDLGYSPIIVEPPNEFRIFAYADGTTNPTLSLRGIDSDRKDVRLTISSYNAWPVYNDSGVKTSGTEPDDVTPLSTEFMEITEATVSGSSADATVTLYAADVNDLTNRFAIAQYHPKITVPRFRRYEIPGVPPGMPVELLVEATIEPIPLVNDYDVLPFDGIEPVEWMIRSDWAMKAGELTQADKYRTNAAQWLQAKEIKDETMQTQIVINSIMAGSPGEISREAENI